MKLSGEKRAVAEGVVRHIYEYVSLFFHNHAFLETGECGILFFTSGRSRCCGQLLLAIKTSNMSGLRSFCMSLEQKMRATKVLVVLR
jgi:hypothetical protein